MIKLYHWFENMWWKASTPPLWLRGLAIVYSRISQQHLQQRASKSIAPPLPLISVGNITAGGSGKTPFVLWLADQLQQLGYAPVILCRGDGGKTTSPHRISKHDHASTVGDEACMLAHLSDCPVIAASDRIAGSQMAQELGDIIILDDGFQYRHLQRCCDIVLIPKEGVGNGHHIPAGPLREPITSLERADIIVRTSSISNTAACQALTNKPSRCNQSEHFSQTKHIAQTEHIWQTETLDIIDIMQTKLPAPQAVYAVCAIARPQRFFDDLKANGLQLTGQHAFPDHHAFTASDVEQILKHHHNIVITAKDAVKLQQLWPKDQPLWLLQQQGKADPALLSAIQKFLPWNQL